jgi:antitoxin (DNA-binding transcriptional repressor) of toxin-antitoxin stability system
MADDLKISDMVEVTAGNLHDNLQFEVIDPNEAAIEDQNKRVKLVTLEASFGAEDKIFEGNSSVEVIDTGTGQIDFTVDGGLVARITAAGLQFGGAGAIVDTIETTITDDDTHFPTSGAVVDALAADIKDIISEGDSSIEIIDAGTGSAIVTIDGTIEATFDPNGLKLKGGGSVNEIEAALTNDATHIPTSAAVFAALIADVKDLISEGNSKVEVIDTGTGSVVITVDGSPIATVTALGLQLVSGAIVDIIETTLTDDDTHLPTSGAVVDALAADVKDIISEGNSSVEVIDAGTGQIDSTVDGSLKATMNVDGLQLKGDQTGGEAIGNAASTVAITFGTAHADANYQVLATVENITDGGPLVLAAIITAKATTGFTATLSAATDSVNYVLNWLVVRS